MNGLKIIRTFTVDDLFKLKKMYNSETDENKKEYGDRKFGSKKPFRGKDDRGGRKFDDRKSLHNGGNNRRRKSDNDIED